MVPLQWLSRIVIDNVDFFIHTNKEKATGRIIAKSNFSNQNTLSQGLFRLIIGFREQSTQFSYHYGVSREWLRMGLNEVAVQYLHSTKNKESLG